MARIIQTGKQAELAQIIVDGLWFKTDPVATLRAVEALQSHAPHKLGELLIYCFDLIANRQTN